MRNKFFITTPIYYVNDIPHIGHAYTTVAADILARYNRLKGKKVFFLTGTDEHGQKVEKAAQEKGRSPKGHADLMVENYKTLWLKLDIKNDVFIRTTDTEHVRTVQSLLQKLWEKGEIEKRLYSGWYCIPDERFWTDKEVVNGNCPDCKRPLERIAEENYFFLMSKYQERLLRYIDENPYYMLPKTRKNEVLGFLKNNLLGDLCISRPIHRLSWGIPLPFDDGFVTYVWFDALVNYYSATKYLVHQKTVKSQGSGVGSQESTHSGQQSTTLDSQLSTLDSEDWWPPDHHLIGKDILTTHAIYWSIMLMALGLSLPKNIFAHGWWTVEGKKMSKSLGNVVDPWEMADKYGVDALRYFLFREVPFGLDGDFSEQALIKRINTDLANDLGNLLSRSLTMMEKYRGEEIPPPIDSKDREGLEKRIKAWFSDPQTSLPVRFDEFLKNLEFHNALTQLWTFINEVNEYIQHAAPWKEKDQDTLSNILYTIAETLRLVAIYLFPFMPSTAEKIWKQLNLEGEISKINLYTEARWGRLKPGTIIRKGAALFPRVEKG